VKDLLHGSKKLVTHFITAGTRVRLPDEYMNENRCMYFIIENGGAPDLVS
jgi:urease accessory protein UreH